MRARVLRWCTVTLPGLALLVASCADLQVPEPAHRPATRKAWEVPASTLTIPVQVSQAQVKVWAENAVPGSLKGEGTGQRTLSAWFMKHDWHYWWNYELRRSPLALRFEANRIQVSASLAGDLWAHWDTLAGDISSEVEADAGVEAALSLGSDWKVLSQTKTFLDVRRADVPIGIAWDGNFFGETISIAKPVQEALRPALETLGKDLDRRVAAMDLKPAVEAAWRDAQEPRAVPGAQDLWVTLDPRTLEVGPLRPSADFLGVDLTVEVHPSIGPKTSLARRPLPPAVSGSPGTPRILLNVPVSLRWDEVLGLSRDLWAQKTPWDMGNGAKIRIKALTAQTDDDRVLLRVEAFLNPPWPGPEIEAVLWLGTHPVWDPVQKTIRLQETSLEVGTKDYLAQAASWVLADRWLRTLERALVWDLGPSLEAGRSRAAGAFQRLDLGRHWVLSATLDQFEVVDYSLTAQGLEVLARAGGTASVTWVP